MAIKTKEFTLKDSKDKPVKVEITTFLGSYGLKISSKITSLILPLITQGIKKESLKSVKSTKSSVLDLDIDFSTISSHLIKHLDDDSIVNLIKEIVAFTRVDGKDLSNEAIFDEVFSGEYGLLIQTLKVILEVNFKSFFVGNGITDLLKVISK